MKRFAVLLIMLLIGALVFGCGPNLEAGTIIFKDYIPEAEWTSYMTISVYNGSSYSTMIIPVHHHRPEQWKFTLEDTIDGKRVRDKVFVSKDIYDAYEVGEYYIINESEDYLKLFVNEERGN